MSGRVVSVNPSRRVRQACADLVREVVDLETSFTRTELTSRRVGMSAS